MPTIEFTEKEYRLIGLYLVNFAEKTAQIKDAQSLLGIKNILEEQYTDGITAIREAYLEGQDIAGVFEDKVSPKLIKSYRFTISESNIKYSLINSSEVDSFNENDSDYVEFANKGKKGLKKKNCVKGTACGFTCIRSGAECAGNMNPAQRKAYYAAKKEAAKQRSLLRKSSATSKAAAQEKVKQAQSAFDNAAADLKRKKQQLELQSRSINTAEQGASFRKLRDEEIPKAERKLRASEEDLIKAKRDASEGFSSGKPMSREEVRKPLTDDEKKEAAKTLKLAGDPRLPINTSQRDKYEEDRAAYERARKAIPDLSVSEYKAIRGYTSYGYIGMNGALRGQQIDPNSDQAKQQRLTARVANQALEKAPKFQGEVRRDSRIPSNEFARDYKVGNTIEFKGITSTTSDLRATATANYGNQSKADAATGQKQEANKASRYEELASSAGIKPLKMEDAQKVEYRIQSKSGRVIKDISVASKESEVALPHGWRGKITKIEDAEDGSKRVFMEEADD